MVVFSGIFHDFTDILSGILEDEVVTSGVICEELGHVIDLSIASDPAAVERPVLFDVLGGEDANSFRGRHRLRGYGDGGDERDTRSNRPTANLVLIRGGAT